MIMSSKAKILYVDDERINLMLFQKIMEKKYDVITAESGEKGMDVLQEHRDIQTVISDMRMPGWSGLEFIRRVKEQFENKKCFILTGYSLNEELKAAIDSGLIIECWTKPADFELIDQAIIANSK